MNTTRKTWDKWAADPLQKKQETHRAQCGFAPGTKADTTLEKSPGPFLCPVLTILLSILSSSLSTVDYYFIMHIWCLSCCMSPASWNSWNLLSFIGLETSHRRAPEKRSIIDVIRNVIGGVVKGLNFFHLWGEGRALGLRTITTGQGFNQYACLVKPQWKSINMGIQGAFGVVSHDSNVRVQCSLGHEGSSQLHFHFALHVSLIFAVLRFILSNSMRAMFEWGSWVWVSVLLSYWTWSGNVTSKF